MGRSGPVYQRFDDLARLAAHSEIQSEASVRAIAHRRAPRLLSFFSSAPVRRGKTLAAHFVNNPRPYIPALAAMIALQGR